MNKSKGRVNKKKKEINKKYPNISQEEAEIIASYTCESSISKKTKVYSPYRILNRNLVSENRNEGITNVSKYIHILLKSLRKLEIFRPENKTLYRGITVKVNIDPENKEFVPYIEGNIKTFQAFISTSTKRKTAKRFLDENKKIGTIFTIVGDIWGYDIQLFNKYNEQEILLEPERKIEIVKYIEQEEDKEDIKDNYDILKIRAEVIGNPNILKNIFKDVKEDNSDIPIEKKEYSDSITIIYKIEPGEERIKIFGEDFINNNQPNYLFWMTDELKIICDEKEYNLIEYFDLNNYNKGKDILEIKLINYSNIRDMSYMFAGCSSLLSLPDINKWETEKVTDMSYMLYECSSLSSLPDISTWNTKNVTDMSCMFYFCSSLESLPDISKWNTSGIKNFKFMFYGCSSLLSLPDISKWGINNVTDMSYMFGGCSSLKSLPEISKWNISENTDKSHMFLRCNDTLNIPLIFKD